jgi:putative OPT family oligopeptide transporter
MATENIQEIHQTPPSGSLPEPDAHKPYVPDVSQMPEFTWSAVLVGAVLGIVFGASSLYLVLKVGMTVSASIPVAVLSITLFRWAARTFGIRKATILENNIVQTTGSAGESIAFGVGVTMPALMLIGFEMEWTRVLVVAVLGGLLGVLMMIPLRRAFIVKLHGKPGEPGKLLYPEGTACAQVLITGERGGTSGKTVFIGFGIAFAHKFITEGMNLLTTTCILPLKLGKNATDAFSRVAKVTGDMASELLGVGYIIGMRTSAIMMAGAVLGGLVLTPALAVGTDKSTIEIYREYLRFIGAGCVAAAGIISMCRTLPMIVRSFSSGISTIRGGMGGTASLRRTEDDMSPKWVLGGSFLLLGLLAAFLAASDDEVTIFTALLGAVLVLVFGFLFVTVSSRLTGEIGSSSNPISGMTVATLLLTCLIFLALGMVRPTDAVLALSIGGVVCIAASNGGTTSQDLKTGYLVGGTPRLQQWAILAGAITSAVIIGGTLLLFNSVGTVYSQRNLPPVNLKDQVAGLHETEAYDGQQYHVWRPAGGELLPNLLEEGKKYEVKPGKYLVDDLGQVCFNVDPTITGEVDQRDKLEPASKDLANITLTKEELDRIHRTFAHRQKSDADSAGKLVFYKLWKNDKQSLEEEKDAEKEEDKKKIEPYRADVPEGLYAVDSSGKIVFEVKGTKVPMKFKAPKTQVMGIIINGLLREKLNWALVMIGACIAIALELCGISSLAFAVGVYIPMQYSSPIFVGGCIRWLVDAISARKAHREAAAATDATARAEAEVRAIAKSETSPGVLFASGLIAGGSLAGVLNAFLNFWPWLQQQLDFAIPGEDEKPPVAKQILALCIFGGLGLLLLLAGIGTLFKAPPEEEDGAPPAAGEGEGLDPRQDADFHIRPS